MYLKDISPIKGRLKLYLATLIVFILNSGLCIGATVTWTGCFNNNWHYAANWSPAQVPTWVDVVIIPNVATVYPHITGIACASQLNITSTATDALTIETGVGGILHIGNSAPTPEQRRIVFVSTSAWTSTTSPATRDTRCNQDAGAAGLCGTYKAWVSNGASNNVSSTSNIAYYTTQGVKVADNWADLTDGTLDAAISRYADGTNASGWQVWTGLNWNGSVTGSSCSNWSNQTFFGTYGSTAATNTQWTNVGTDDCQNYSVNTVGYYTTNVPVTPQTVCDNCYPGSTATFCSSGNLGVDESCVWGGTPICCDGCCRTVTPSTAKSMRHYCFQQ